MNERWDTLLGFIGICIKTHPEKYARYYFFSRFTTKIKRRWHFTQHCRWNCWVPVFHFCVYGMKNDMLMERLFLQANINSPLRGTVSAWIPFPPVFASHALTRTNAATCFDLSHVVASHVHVMGKSCKENAVTLYWHRDYPMAHAILRWLPLFQPHFTFR